MTDSLLTSTRIALVVHIYHLDLWSEISEAISRMPIDMVLFVTTSQEQIDDVRKRVFQDFPDAHVYGFVNRGRDIGPLLELMKFHRLEDYNLILKIHSKKSLNARFGSKDVGKYWRKNLLNQLIPLWGVDEIISFFDRHPYIGMAGPREFLVSVGSSMYSKDTHENFLYLLKILDNPVKPEVELFFAGTMFWARGTVFGALRLLGLQQKDLEAETGQTDGTLAHAIERIFPLLVKSVGLHTKAFPLWDFRKWVQERVPSPAQVIHIKNLLMNYEGGPNILMLIIDKYDEPNNVALTIKSLEALSSWSLNIRALVKRNRSGLREVISSANPDWFFIVEAGTELTVSGLLMVVLKIIQNPSACAVFADEMETFPGGKVEVNLRPDFNLDLLLSCPSLMSHHWFFKVHSLREIAWGHIENTDWIELDIILRLIENTGLHDLLHVPEPLVLKKHSLTELIGFESVVLRHLYARNYSNARIYSKVPGMYRIEYAHDQQPVVSIIIYFSDELFSLIRCIESLLEVTAYPYYEIIVADNVSQGQEAILWLDSINKLDGNRLRVMRMNEKSSRAQVFNKAILNANGEYLLFLSSEAIFKQAEWLNLMLNHAQRPEVAVVGPQLSHPLQLVKHAGFILGLRSVVSRPFIYKSFGEGKSYPRFLVDQNYSALPDICFLTKLTVFNELGGFDEFLFDEFYADSDFCLKAVSSGYINVWTPHAEVTYSGSVHHESISESTPRMVQEIHDEQRENFYRKWIDLIAADPSYNIHFSLFSEGFTVDDRKEMFVTHKDTYWSPLTWRPMPVICAQPSDRNGCGHYRIIQPFNALKSAGLIDGLIEDSMAISIDAARLKPDVLVFQRLLSESRLTELKKMKMRQKFFTIIDLDDNLLDIPKKNYSQKFYADKNIVKNIKEGLSLADRFVVSTQGLAEVFSGFHHNIVVSELKLPTDWWANLHSSRDLRSRPRVGWAGSISHTGDLELITDVVKSLAGEVDWVFFGMCPDSLRPWVKEFHNGVPIDLYPEKLASLNLDLAIAPLENNIFNDCKSNLRLLEYGACAYPVVCSDTRAYRESGLPVTVVKNRFKDWVSAIRMHINDLDEAQRCGNALRQAVLSGWMLRGSALEKWRDSWMPN